MIKHFFALPQVRIGCFILFLLPLPCITTILTAPSLEETGLNAIKYVLTIPAAAQEIESHYFGHWQYRAAMLKFNIARNQLGDFLSTTCFHNENELSSRDIPFQIGPKSVSDPRFPEWWIASEDTLSKGGTCMNFQIGIAQDSANAIVYLFVVF
jgi:hypothetical protein